MSAVETAYLIARVLTCGIWIPAALYKATHYERTIGEITHHGIPLARVVLPLVLVLELVGSALLIVDRYVWAVCVAWLIFLIPASWIYHGRFMVRAGTIDFVQYLMFWKNVSIAGGLFALIVLDTTRPQWLFGGG